MLCEEFRQVYMGITYPFIPCATNEYYYPTALRSVQMKPKTSTKITQYLYSGGPVGRIFSQRASDELDRGHEKKIVKTISFLRLFLTEILQ